MRLTLTGHDHRYAVEQTLLMLLPREPLDGGPEDPDSCTVALSEDTASALFTYRGQTASARASAHELGLDTPDGRKGVEQRLVKLAAYRAVTSLIGPPPWGALSGVRPAKLAAKWLKKGASSLDVVNLLTGLYGLDRPKAALTIRCAHENRALDEALAPNDVGLYIGIPFCPTRCAYCSFISADVAGSAKLVSPYVDALEREICWAGDYLPRKGLTPRMVYMGGGTPTTLSARELDALLTALDRRLDRSALLEYTVEAGRPDTITAEKLSVLRDHGVDRISVNPQTLEPHVLKAMGRAHTPEDFFRAYELAAPMGFQINTDLIAGLPQDTPAGFARTLDAVLSLGPEQVTVHTLALKHGSRLNEGELASRLPGAEAVSQMLDYADRSLSARLYAPYYLYRQKYMTGAMENVGWTRIPGGSPYNILMMEELRSVLALGAGGITKIIDPAAGRIDRFNNPKYPKEYLDRLGDTMKEREGILWPIN